MGNRLTTAAQQATSCIASQIGGHHFVGNSPPVFHQLIFPATQMTGSYTRGVSGERLKFGRSGALGSSVAWSEVFAIGACMRTGMARSAATVGLVGIKEGITVGRRERLDHSLQEGLVRVGCVAFWLQCWISCACGDIDQRKDDRNSPNILDLGGKQDIFFSCKFISYRPMIGGDPAEK